MQTLEKAPTALLSIGNCTKCGILQLVDRFTLAFLQSKAPTLQFREPRKHLPELVSKLSGLEEINQHSRFLGVSYIDEDLLVELTAAGYDNVATINFSMLAGWHNGAGLETMQSLLTTPASHAAIKLAVGTVDVLVARFILEHAESAIVFLRALASLVRPNGYIVIEVPDATKMLEAGNHALVWEDHFTYFTDETLQSLLNRAGLTIVALQRYVYAYEDALVAIVRVNSSGLMEDAAEQSIGLPLLDVFAAGFERKKSQLRVRLASMIAGGERLAVFGAGHHTAKYLNFYGIADLFEFAVDDNPLKTGLYLPGTNLCVRSSEYLMKSAVKTCFSALDPETEKRVRNSMADFFARGGNFIPMFNLVGDQNEP